MLVVKGDSQMVIRKIKGTYSCNNKRLQAYKKQVYDLIEYFQAFNIRSIPQRENTISNMLATSASTLLPMEQTRLKIFYVELVVARSILGNITNF